MTKYKKITQELLDSLPGKRIMLSEMLCYGPAEDCDFECLPDSMEIVNGELWFKDHEIIRVSMGPAGYLEFDGFDVTLDEVDEDLRIKVLDEDIKVRFKVELKAVLEFDFTEASVPACHKRCEEYLIHWEDLTIGEVIAASRNKDPEFSLDIVDYSVLEE